MIRNILLCLTFIALNSSNQLKEYKSLYSEDLIKNSFPEAFIIKFVDYKF